MIGVCLVLWGGDKALRWRVSKMFDTLGSGVWKNAGDGRGPIYIDGQRVAWPLPTENRGHRRWKTLIGLLLEVSYAARPLAA